MDYRKFYNLEPYLLNEVGPRFRETGKLDALDFYAILHWKAPRAKTRHLNRLGPLEEAVRGLTSAIKGAPTPKEKLEAVMNGWGFRLPTASAILSVLYPKEFTVYDRRVAKELGDRFAGLDQRAATKIWPLYEEFRTAVQTATPYSILRDADRYLWGRSLYRDLALQIGRNGPTS